MTQTPVPVRPHETSALPGAVIIARIRRLLVVALVAGVAYTTLMHAQKEQCTGEAGAEHCVSLSFSPSPLIVIGIAVIVLYAISRVLRTAVVAADALRILDRAAIVIAALTVVSLVIGYVWFAVMPIPDTTNPYLVVFPFPFASGELTTTP